MSKEQRGFDWRSKLPIVFGTAVIVGLGAYISLFKSSPGELSDAHQRVAGSAFISDCNKCHLHKDVPAACLRCHAEIKEELAQSKGFHSQLLSGKKTECAHCHSEHNGKQFNLVNSTSWGGKDPAKTFKHTFTNFRLTGKHDAVACGDCHVKNAKIFSLAEFSKYPRKSTYLGLSQECVSCHKDPHAGGKITDCEKCHTQAAWKPAPGFDHDKFYPLRDGHAAVSCSKCHTAAPGATVTSVNFGPVKGKSCRDCHATPHKTDWKLACGACHTDRAVPWGLASKRLTSAQHDAAGFRLQNPHAKVSCAKCHDPALPYAKRYVSLLVPGRPRLQNSCESCHKDPHAGQFLAKHPRCLDCHSDKSFKPSRFGVKEHAPIYPLLGGHARASCASCHVRDPKLSTVRFSGSPRDCASCHKDPHVGQFRGASGVTRCEACHEDVSSWRTVVFDHDRARFKLDAAHKGVACKECHPTVQLPGGRRIVQYKPVRSACSDCHDIKR